MSKNKIIKKCLKVLVSGLLLFLFVLTLDSWFFFDDHFTGGRKLMRLYLEPVFALFELINLVFSIDESKIYMDLLYPRWNNPVMFYIGIPWSIFLAWLYTKITIIKKDRFLNLIAYSLLVFLVLFASAQITAAIFGSDFSRFCPGCP